VGVGLIVIIIKKRPLIESVGEREGKKERKKEGGGRIANGLINQLKD
jgi:hypothetical protein